MKSIMPRIQPVLVFPFFSALVLLGGCQTISRNAGELNLPEGTVIFSFDDGPNRYGDTTARLLEVLERHEIRALFVLLGENAAYNPELARLIYQKGHIIISHGYGNQWAVWMNKRRFCDNLIRWEDCLAAALGEIPQPRLYRPHGGFYTARQERIWQNAGYTMIPVTARAYDAALGESGRAKAVSAVLCAVEKQGKGIILLHDAKDSQAKTEAQLAGKKGGGSFDRSWIPGTAEEIILRLKERGYRLNGFDLLEVLGL
jgi:peptidoglycan/xylan/chitin deacetylase (PgdA/CDA1 family)